MNHSPDIANHAARVLIVDDEIHNRHLLEFMLAGKGFVVLTAASGEEALAIVAQQPLDLILLDIMMPGMDGYEVAEVVKGNPATSNIPIIMVTALDDRNARMLGLNAGVEEFLTKPVDRAELSVRVTNLLRLKAYADFQDRYNQILEGEVSARTAQLVRAQQINQQAQKMESMGRLASGIAHDFNNLLTVILGFTELVATDTTTTTVSMEGLNEITKAARRAAGLTGQLLAFSRQQVLNMEARDLNALITGMAGMLRRMIGDGISMTLTLAPDLPPAFVDGGQFEQVVMNLVVNARDAMPDGGHLTIQTTDIELERGVSYEEEIVPGRYVKLAITDTGCGMTEETRRRLFEPFYTTKALGKGTGLGLSTTYGIVKQSKGYIWAASELGVGTTFTVYLRHASLGAP